MKSKLTNFCSAIEFASCDAHAMYLVDYTDSTNSKRGVELLCNEVDLAGLLLDNSASEINITTAVFDDHCFKEADGITDEEHCEAVLFPEPFETESWLLFVELKYAKFLSGDLGKAFRQVIKTVQYFRHSALIERNKVVCGVISFPITKKRPPYENFLFANNHQELRSIRKIEKLVLWGVNEITIDSTNKLSVKS